jgi:O-acetylserine/cysteine efflux transporter
MQANRAIEFSHLLLAVLVMFIWGFNYVVIEVGLQEIPPLLLCFVRFFLTSIPAIFFVKFPKTSKTKVALYGLVMFALQFVLLFMGIYSGVPPGLASLLLQTHVFFSVFLGLLFLKEKLHLWQVLGAICSFIGISLVGFHVGGDMTASGILLIIGAAFSWAVGNLISKEIGKVDMIALVVWGTFVSWPPLLAISLIVDGPGPMVAVFQNINWISIGAVAYITYLSTFFAFGMWSWLLHEYRLSVIAPFTLLVPVIAIGSSSIFLNEPIEIWKIYAAMLVIGGLCIHLLGPKLFAKR